MLFRRTRPLIELQRLAACAVPADALDKSKLLFSAAADVLVLGNGAVINALTYFNIYALAQQMFMN